MICLENVCESEQYDIYPSNKEYNYEIIQDGKAEGEIIGGNLCTLNLLQGTDYMPNLADKILFVEDDNIVGEFFPLNLREICSHYYKLKVLMN